jgi:uncharacterized membrane-anchored protein YhcB (DUF1043 family)
MDLNDNQYTLLGIIIGGIGLKVVEYFAKKRQGRVDRIAELEKQLDARSDETRQELRDDLAELRQRFDTINDDLDEWKEKYWARARELNDLQLENAKLLAELVRKSNGGTDA